MPFYGVMWVREYMKSLAGGGNMIFWENKAKKVKNSISYTILKFVG